jgi:hypothetical protein
MAYTTNWLVDRRVLLIRLYNEVSLEEVAQLGTLATVLVDEPTHPFHKIVDTRLVADFPTDIKALLNILNHDKLPHEGKTIVWTTNRLLLIVVLSLRRLAKTLESRLLVMSHPIAIRQYLASLDPTLAQLPPFEDFTNPTFPPHP